MIDDHQSKFWTAYFSLQLIAETSILGQTLASSVTSEATILVDKKIVRCNNFNKTGFPTEIRFCWDHNLLP